MIKLVVFMEPEEKQRFLSSGSFNCEPESIGGQVKRFCEGKNLFSYSDVFVSIAVLRADEEPCDSGAYVYALEKRPSLSALDFALVKQSDEILQSIELVGNDDLKQILSRFVERSKTGEPYDSLLKQIRDLRSVPIGLRPQELLKMTRGHGSHDYSEARLNRALKLSEVEGWYQCNGVDVTSEGTSPGDEIADYFR